MYDPRGFSDIDSRLCFPPRSIIFPTHYYQRDVIFRDLIADDVSHDVTCDVLGGCDRHCLAQTREANVE